MAFIVRRLVAAVPVLVLVLIIIFALARLIPGDPAVTLLGPGASDQQIAELRSQLGLDQSLAGQFTGYTTALLRGDLGTSLQSKRSIAGDLADYLPATIELAVTALLIAVVVGVPLGVLAAVRAGSGADHGARLLSLVGVSAPAFWLALLLQVLFGIVLGWLPVSGRVDVLLRPEASSGFLLLDAVRSANGALFWDALRHLILPASVLAAFLVGTIVRVLRAGILEQLGQDYVRTAAAKGLTSRTVLTRHVLRNSFLPTLTIVGLKFTELLGGAILTETVFAWPGMGRYMFEAIAARDYPVIQATTLIFALLFIASSLVVDLCYGLLDPRIRLAGAG